MKTGSRTVTPPPRKSLWEKLFLSYGAGSHLWLPIYRSRYFNAISWTIVILATVAWAVDLVVYYFFW